jgi:hypothetical protein
MSSSFMSRITLAELAKDREFLTTILLIGSDREKAEASRNISVIEEQMKLLKDKALDR